MGDEPAGDDVLVLAYGWHQRGLPEPHRLSDAELSLVAFTANEFHIAPDVFRSVALGVPHSAVGIPKHGLRTVWAFLGLQADTTGRGAFKIREHG